MATDIFDYVVVGNEPYGFWFLKNYEALVQALPSQLRRHLPSPRLAHIDLYDTKTIALTKPIASAFGISQTSLHSVEFISPKSTFFWNLKTIREKFPELSDFIPNLSPLVSPPQQVISSIQYTLRNRPELLSISLGLWKLFGMSEPLSPVPLVWSALLCHEYSFWDASLDLPKEATCFSWPSPHKINAVTPHKDGTLGIEFDNQEPIRSRNWIFATSLSTVLEWGTQCKDFRKLFSLSPEVFSQDALYPLTIGLKADKAPTFFSPRSIYFNSEEIPEYRSEIWPIEYQKKADGVSFTIWVNARREFSLESLQENLGFGYQCLNTIYPKLSDAVVSVFPSLGIEPCFLDEQRKSLLSTIEKTRREIYRYTTLSPRTNHKGLFILPPSIHCYLPYPLGQLKAAKTLLVEILGKKRFNYGKEIMEQRATPA